MLADQVERLVVDDRVDDLGEGVADDGADVGLVPAAGDAQGGLAELPHPLLVGADLLEDELAPEGPGHQPPRDHAGPVERRAERDHGRLGDHGLVEVEEGGLHAGEHTGARSAAVGHRRAASATPPGRGGTVAAIAP